MPADPLAASIVFNDMSVSGGAQRQAIMLAVELQNLGYTPRLTAYLADTAKCFPDLLSQTRVETLPTDFKPRTGHYVGAPFCTGNKHHLHLEKSRRVAQMALAAGTPVINLHDFQVFEVAAFIPPGPAVIWMLNDVHELDRMRAERQGLRRAVGGLLAGFGPRRRRTRTRIRALDRIDRIVVLDHRNKDRVKEAFGREADIVRSGAVLPPMPGDRETPAADRPMQLLSVGILAEHRRFEDLIRAADILTRQGRPARVKLVGRADFAPDYAAMLRSLVGELKLDGQVEFINSLSDADLDAAYRTADVFVFPHSPQTWGLSPFEAIARGTPAVVTTGCGASEVLENEVTAMITEPHRPEALAAAIGRLANEPDLYRRIRADGLAYVHANISWRRYAEQMDRIFREELKQR